MESSRIVQSTATRVQVIALALVCMVLAATITTATAQSPTQHGAVDLILSNGQVKTPAGSDETLGEQECVALGDAFRIFTENGARLMGQRDHVGTIEVGMHADVIVVETNPFEMPITEVNAAKVRMTFIDGEKVFDAASPPKLSAY